MLKYTSLKDDFQLFLCKKDSTDGIGPFLIELKPMNNVVLIPCNFNQADYLIFRYKKWYMYWTLTDKDFSFRKYYFSLTFDKKPLHSGNLFSINKYTSRDINHIHYVYKWGISSDETSGGEERSYIGNRCLYNKEIKDIIRSLR
jgi:hypothetical protein